MDILLTAVVFLVIFSVLVLIHEYGHYIMAKRAGVRVEEFGFGLPPRIWGKKIGETLYSVNWIPFGGFVRLFGEDSSDPKMMRSSRSFVAKPMRARVKIIVAGVVMNFLLAWLLLFVGFSVGMEPLLGPDDVFDAVSRGQVVLESGIKIEKIEDTEFTVKTGLQVDDVLLAFNGEELDQNNVKEFLANPVGHLTILRNGQLLEDDIEGDLGDFKKMVKFYDFVSFPRVEVFEVWENSTAFSQGLRKGDVILEVNGQQIFNNKQFDALIKDQPRVEYKVYRDGLVGSIAYDRQGVSNIIVNGLEPMSPALLAGLKPSDIIISVNNQNFYSPEKMIEFVQANKDKDLTLLIKREGQIIPYQVKTNEEGRIGVYLSELIDYRYSEGFSVYNQNVLSSVVEIKEEKYPLHLAFVQGFKETYRLSKLTAQMFIGFIRGLVAHGEVPDSVSGPVGIAQMTHVFVQEGFIPIIRFVAILSLSLAVINILPFPALDGGRLLFIIIELILGRRVNQKWETVVHGFGYLLIILLILAVTYSDIMRLIK